MSVLNEVIQILTGYQTRGQKPKGLVLSIINEDNSMVTLTSGNLKGSKEGIKKAIAEHGKN